MRPEMVGSALHPKCLGGDRKSHSEPVRTCLTGVAYSTSVVYAFNFHIIHKNSLETIVKTFGWSEKKTQLGHDYTPASRDRET